MVDPNAFWRTMSDRDFFSNKVHHIYFYQEVSTESVQALRTQILEAAKSYKTPNGVWVNAKPIVVHIHSPGGDMYASQWFMSLFNQVSVPICSMVDGDSSSAATMLSILAPFRVATPLAMTMIHDYWGINFGKREQIKTDFAMAESTIELYHSLYAARTRISREELDAIMRRDLSFDAATCMRYGIYDRVLFEDMTPVLRAPPTTRSLKFADAPFRKTNWNNMFVGCNLDVVRQLDGVIQEGDNAKPIVLTAPSGAPCIDDLVMITLVSRILASPVPVYGIVDNDVTWWDFLPMLFCHRVYMYENARLVSTLAYARHWGSRLEDILYNTDVIRGMFRRSLLHGRRNVRGGEHGVEKLVHGMFDKNDFMTAEKCKRLGLVDDVVTLRAALTPATGK